MSSLRLSLRQEQRQKFSLEHRPDKNFTLRLSLIQVLSGELYTPRGNCPMCSKQLTPAEILSGFNDDPNDFTTGCPGCEYRFRPLLVSDGVSQLELPFFCPIQVLAQLPGREGLSPQDLARDDPAIYRSAVIHFGTIQGAFRSAGLSYPYTDTPSGWEQKVAPFLGRLPDKVIAECLDVTVYAIRKLRTSLGIQSYKNGCRP